MFFRVAVIAFSFLFLAGYCQAQVTTGNLEGYVLDQDGQPVPEVDVTVTGPWLKAGRTIQTTNDGYFLLQGLPIGSYEISFSHPEYLGPSYGEVVVHLDKTTSLGFITLDISAHVIPEMVVTANKPIIDPSSAKLGENLKPEIFDTLPIERDYRSIANLLPHTNITYRGDGTNFAGATGIENLFFIDGIDVTEPVTASSGTRLPYNFVREIQVRTGGYEAEYRSSLGGAINAVTYSGGNETTGQVFGFFTNSSLADEPRQGPLVQNTGDFSQYDVGFGLGGALRKDKLFYYLAFNPAETREDIDIPGLGYYEDKTTAYSYAGKLTWHSSEDHSLIFTAIGDPTERQAVGEVFAAATEPASFLNPDPYLMDFQYGGINFALSDQYFLSNNLVLDSSVSWSQFKNHRVPSTSRGMNEDLFIDQEIAQWSEGATDHFKEDSQVLAVDVSSTWHSANHTLKAGLSYRDVTWKIDQNYSTLMRFADDYYFWFKGYSVGEVGTRNPSAFLQDSWRVSKKWRINLGVRWDGQYIVASDGNVAQTFLDQWQPRIGLIFQPDQEGKSKLSASVGRFYQNLSAYPLFFYYNEDLLWEYITYDHDPRGDPSGADVFAVNGTIQPERDLSGQYFDEIILSYERRIKDNGKLVLRGIYRTLGEGLEDGYDPDTYDLNWGYPGKGELSPFPEFKRDYAALEFSYQQQAYNRLNINTSYVLSKSQGNYPGLFSEQGLAQPNAGIAMDYLETTVDADGMLPNNRTHIFKFSGDLKLGAGFSLGTFAWLATGTPKNEKGAFPAGFPQSIFLQPRGEAGTTPTIWDLNFRVSYRIPMSPTSGWQPRLTLDLLHIGSPQEEVLYDEVHYLGVDDQGNQIFPNPTYDMPTRYQPPMALRFGAEILF